ncbi:MAG: hypothetical protein U5L03_02290 [Burkholderiaceae bacterium]|nr:hypothetical protein [Burkholderiaceae bacterium]
MATLPPLSHHEIFTLVAPFAQAGYQVDLAATDRVARRLVFKPRVHEDQQGLAAPWQPVHEVLALDCALRGSFELQRSLTTANGLTATLEGEGDDPAALLAAFAAVPAARQFPSAGSVALPLQHRLLRAAPGQAAPALVLKQAQARLPGLALQMKVSGVSGYAAEIAIERSGGAIEHLPADLLEVLGRAWHRLTPNARGWTTHVELRGTGERRGADSEARLAQMVTHLAHTLAEPPLQFHQRHRAARWLIAARSTWPIALTAVVLGAGLWLQGRGAAADSALAMLANLAPPLLLGAFFLRREMPRIGLPRVPRQPPADAWRLPD